MGPQYIKIGLDVKDKWDAIDKMLQLLSPSKNITNIELVKQSMVERERIMSTGIGRGVGIPHSISDGAKQMAIAAAVLSKPLEFDSLDFQPVKVIFSIATPKDRDKTYMQALAAIAKLFSLPNFTEIITNAKSPVEFLDIIKKNEY
jgi:mannitol/fructose-specific phosphotransferase system IIA component (Ntr-type)